MSPWAKIFPWWIMTIRDVTASISGRTWLETRTVLPAPS